MPDYGLTQAEMQSLNGMETELLGQAAAGAMAGVAVGVILGVILGIITLVGIWKVYKKANQPGWAAIIPFYNTYILTKIVDRPLWVFVLIAFGGFLGWIPVVGWLLSIGVLVLTVIVWNDLSKCFGRGVGTTIGLIFLPFIFFPILGFGDAKYTEPTKVKLANSSGVNK